MDPSSWTPFSDQFSLKIWKLASWKQRYRVRLPSKSRPWRPNETQKQVSNKCMKHDLILGSIWAPLCSQQIIMFWWFFVKHLNISWDILQKMKFWNRVWFTCFSWKYLENTAFACTAAQNALFDFPKNMTFPSKDNVKIALSCRREPHYCNIMPLQKWLSFL